MHLFLLGLALGLGSGGYLSYRYATYVYNKGKKVVDAIK